MMALCKSRFRIGTLTSGISFEVGKWYEYRIEIHEETGTKLYFIDDLPMLERTFKENFDNIQQIRDEKINQILDERCNG